MNGAAALSGLWWRGFRRLPSTHHHREPAIAQRLIDAAAAEPDELLKQLGTTSEGLTTEAAAQRLSALGPNLVAHERQQSIVAELIGRARNPLNFLLLALAAISYVLGDKRAAAVIAVMVLLSVSLAFIQEHRSNQAAARLRAMVRTTATVLRRIGAGQQVLEVPIEELVPGDVVRLSAGDLIPADLRALAAKDLFLNEAALTGEAMPVEKSTAAVHSQMDAPTDMPNVCFMGSNVLSGAGTAVVVQTGARTYFGELAGMLIRQRAPTSFDKGVTRFTWLMIRFMAVMVPSVFVINGVTKGDWLEALMFALAVAVGLTPEMLPMIVTVNLAKGAIAMSRKRVIVKRLNSIQNFGAMDVLCTDKTGTLTQDKIILMHHFDLHGRESNRVLEYAYLNSHYQSGLKNLLDVAVLDHVEMKEHVQLEHRFQKIDELPFDFSRRRMSVVLATEEDKHLLICKGAVEEVFAACAHYAMDGEAAASSVSAPSCAPGSRRRTDAENPSQRGLAIRRAAPSSSIVVSSSATVMMTICFAIDRNGIATVTARAASGVDFHAMTTVSGRADIGPEGGINKGRPLLMRAASSVSGGTLWSSPGRPMTKRSAVRAYSTSQ